MASRRAIRRWTGVALGGAVGLGVLLTVLVYEQDTRARSDARDPAALQALQASCKAKQERDARTVSMTPDAAAAEAPPERSLTPGLEAAEPVKVAEAGKSLEPVPAPQPQLPPGVTPKRQLRMTDYGFIAHNKDLQYDPCTEYYRARLSLR